MSLGFLPELLTAVKPSVQPDLDILGYNPGMCVLYLGMALLEFLTNRLSLGTLPKLCFSLQDDQLLDDGKTLGECGFTSQTARPQAPATVGLAFRADEAFEALRIEPFSSPPELPDVMKPQDSGGSANEQAVQ